jgi:multisubunit Na+/H+ antiporter MnhG subunit
MARSWGVALSILGVGLAAEREDGLTAALLVLAAFTVYLATSLTLRALERTPTT